MQKGSQHGAKINAKAHKKSMQKLVVKKERKIMQHHVFLKCKNTFMIGTYSKFEVLQGECANGKIIKKSSNMRPKSMPKSRKNQCKIHARKSDAKNMENHQQLSPKGSQKPLTINKKRGPKK